MEVLSRNEIKMLSFVQHFYAPGKNEICMHMGITKHKSYHFCDSTHRLNVPVFVFKTGIVQYKDEWQKFILMIQILSFLHIKQQ